MSERVPGFPPELETAITEALERHLPWWDPSQGSSGCFGCPDTFWSFDRDGSTHRSHVAAVVMEVIAQHTTTEWGVRSEHHIGDYTSPARSEEHADGMLRGYAKHGSHAEKFARLVLPWQGVQA